MTASSDPVERLERKLRQRATGFAAGRPDVGPGELRLGSRGLHPDECAAFLDGLDGGYLEVDGAGFVTSRCTRTKKVGGRYALVGKSASGTAVHTEYLIQLGAAAELVTLHGWNPEDLLLEQGEFDLVGFGPDGRVVLAMEAKARVVGPDSLEKLLRSFRTLSADPAATVAPNAARKWRKFVRYCRQGPVVLWLVAAGAAGRSTPSPTATGSRSASVTVSRRPAYSARTQRPAPVADLRSGAPQRQRSVPRGTGSAANLALNGPSRP